MEERGEVEVVMTQVMKRLETTRRWAALPLVSVGLLIAAACTVTPPTPPPVPPPDLPAGIGVEWTRDLGGTNDPVDGTYTPDAQQYVTMDGSTTGPTPSSAMRSRPSLPVRLVAHLPRGATLGFR